jgi:hypothetical protein
VNVLQGLRCTATIEHVFVTEEGQERAEELDAAAAVLRGCTEALDVAALTATDAAALVAKAVEVERLAAGARVLLSAKAAEAGTWRAKGHRSPEDWLAQQAGTSVGQAKGDLETSKKLSQCPKTERAVREGKVSPEQAREITDAAAADPASEGDLLGLAEKGAAHKELRDESRRRKAAADPDPEATARRIQRDRRIGTGTDPDGTWWLHARGPTAAGAGVMAALRRQADRIFAANRRAGTREHPDAYLFDALVQLLTGAPSPAAATPPPAGGAATSGAAATSGPGTAAEPSAAGAGAPDAGGRASAPAGPAGGARHQPQGGTPAPAASGTPAPADPGAAAGDVATPPSNGDPHHTADGTSDRSEASPAQTSGVAGRSPVPGSGPPGTARPAGTGPPGGPGGPVATGAGPPGADAPASAGPPGRSSTADDPNAVAPTLPGLDVAPPPVPRAVLPSGANAKIIVRIDHTALVRGYPVAGEVCEVDGIGTVDVASVRAWMTDAFVAAVLTDGTDITKVVHLGRRATAQQTTALQAAGIRCQRLGCGRTEGLQLDHRADWSRTKQTEIGELDWLCRYDHSLKTLYGWQLEPGTGPRRMHPPEEQPGPSAA